MNFYPGKLILKLSAWISELHQNLSEYTVLMGKYIPLCPIVRWWYLHIVWWWPTPPLPLLGDDPPPPHCVKVRWVNLLLADLLHCEGRSNWNLRNRDFISFLQPREYRFWKAELLSLYIYCLETCFLIWSHFLFLDFLKLLEQSFHRPIYKERFAVILCHPVCSITNRGRIFSCCRHAAFITHKGVRRFFYCLCHFTWRIDFCCDKLS